MWQYGCGGFKNAPTNSLTCLPSTDEAYYSFECGPDPVTHFKHTDYGNPKNRLLKTVAFIMGMHFFLGHLCWEKPAAKL